MEQWMTWLHLVAAWGPGSVCTYPCEIC